MSNGEHDRINSLLFPISAFKTRQIGEATRFIEQLETNVCFYLKEERINSVPDRLFKIIFVGNSSVGKTSFLRRFCEDRFFPGTAATVGKFKKHYYYFCSNST